MNQCKLTNSIDIDTWNSKFLMYVNLDTFLFFCKSYKDYIYKPLWSERKAHIWKGHCVILI
jgi:hypothetical protein